jgi:hypothetical protein
MRGGGRIGISALLLAFFVKAHYAVAVRLVGSELCDTCERQYLSFCTGEASKLSPTTCATRVSTTLEFLQNVATCV